MPFSTQNMHPPSPVSAALFEERRCRDLPVTSVCLSCTPSSLMSFSSTEFSSDSKIPESCQYTHEKMKSSPPPLKVHAKAWSAQQPPLIPVLLGQFTDSILPLDCDCKRYHPSLYSLGEPGSRVFQMSRL